MPEATYVYCVASLRWVALAVLVAMVFRDIMRPELDVVRATYGDDPDGGDFAGAPDDGLTVKTPRVAGVDPRLGTDRRTLTWSTGSVRRGHRSASRTGRGGRPRRPGVPRG